MINNNMLIRQELLTEHIFLPKYITDFVDCVKWDFNNQKKLVFHNIKPRNKILLFWPPGNWKTTIAKHIAKEMGFPFSYVDGTKVVEASLWHSSKNVKQIFDSIKMSLENTVIFVDEIDAFCLARGTNVDKNWGVLLENNRIVTEFLLWLDNLGSSCVFIAATNIFNWLDEAVKRRFDIKLEVKNPTEEEKTIFAESLLAFHRATESMKRINFDLAACNTFNDVKMNVLDGIRNFLIK